MCGGVYVVLNCRFLNITRLVTPAGVEPATSSSASLRSIQLSYGAIKRVKYLVSKLLNNFYADMVICILGRGRTCDLSGVTPDRSIQLSYETSQKRGTFLHVWVIIPITRHFRKSRGRAVWPFEILSLGFIWKLEIVL